MYPALSEKSEIKIPQRCMDFLQYADGKNDIQTIAKKLKINLSLTKKTYTLLKKNKLVE